MAFVSNKVSLSTFLSLIVITCLSNTANSQVPQQERGALIALYNATNGPNWSNNSNWLGATGSECSWHGITCTNNSVTEISQWNNGLTGSLPGELGNLPNLKRLVIYYSQVAGSIPSEIGNLTNLRELALSSNQLTGLIPSELGNLSSLTELELDDNKLTGPIPPELGNLSSLRLLRLSNNQFTGPIPNDFGNLSGLELLFLENNQFDGSIPAVLGNLTGLLQLGLSNNLLTGSIPPELGNLTNLLYLWLGSNQLNGPIPAALGSLTSVWNIHMNNNALTGAIPPELGNLQQLQILRLDSNQLTGSIPSELGNPPDLWILDVSNNQLTGNIPQSLTDKEGLDFNVEGNEGLGWPSPYNGVTPDPELELEFNNIGVFSSDDQLIYACLSILSNGLRTSVDGIERWGIAFETVSVDEGIIKVNKVRQFNKGNALNGNAQQPDCSGEFETTTGIYTDIIDFGTEIHSVAYELYDPISLEFKLLNRNLIYTYPAPVLLASFNGSVLNVPVVVVGEQFFQIDLTLVEGAAPAEFILTAAEELFNVSTDGASVFSEGNLSIPSITVGEQRYWIDLLLIDANLIIFQLVDAGLN